MCTDDIYVHTNAYIGKISWNLVLDIVAIFTNWSCMLCQPRLSDQSEDLKCSLVSVFFSFAGILYLLSLGQTGSRPNKATHIGENGCFPPEWSAQHSTADTTHCTVAQCECTVHTTHCTVHTRSKMINSGSHWIIHVSDVKQTFD